MSALKNSTEENISKLQNQLVKLASEGYVHFLKDAGALGSRINYIDCLKDALSKGADVNGINELGDTALMGAVCNFEAKIVKFLLSNGADPSIKNNQGYTPLEVLSSVHDCVSESSQVNFLSCMTQLLDAGAPIEGLNKDGHTPLSSAISSSIKLRDGQSSFLLLLLARDADVLFQTPCGKTIAELILEQDTSFFDPAVAEYAKSAIEWSAINKDMPDKQAFFKPKKM